jgi:hypothetical protein
VWLEVNRPIHCFLLNDLLVCTSEKKLQPDANAKGKARLRAEYLFSFALADIYAITVVHYLI